MTNKKDEDSFNGMMEDFSEPQCDEQEDLPTDPEPDRNDYKGRQHMFQKEWMDWNDRIYPPEPPSAKYVAMDDAMTKPYEYVKNPGHYQWFDMEAIDAIEKVLTHEQFKGFLMGTSMRYRFRCGSKPGEPLERDINKAKQYEEYWYEYVKRNTPK